MWAIEHHRRRCCSACRKPVFALLLIGLNSAWAQPAPVVTEADLARARRVQPAITERDIERAQQRHRSPTDAELARVPVPSTPNLDALPQPASRAPVNLEALARGFEVQGAAASLATPTGPSLLVFISLSMPEATLARLVDQAARARASLVLRGLVNGSLTETVARMQRLIGTRQVSVQIDPQAFDRYAISKAPSFVLAPNGSSPQNCDTGLCAATDPFVMAAGDVSLDYALRHFQRTTPRLAKQAGVFLQRLGR